MKVFRNFLIIILCISCRAAYPQNNNRQEVSVNFGGGMSGVNYSSLAGLQKNGFGGQFGLGYHYCFLQNFALGTGLDFALYNGNFNIINHIEHHRWTKDYNNEDFLFISTASDLYEKQRSTILQIPLMAQYQKNLLYVAAGLKIGIPLTGKFESSGTFKNMGYYEEENFHYDDDPDMGFYEYTLKRDGKLDLKAAFFVSLEAGIKLDMKNDMFLYVGAYLDYGLNNIRSAKLADLADFVKYNSNDRDFSINSVVQSQYLNGNASAFTDKLSPMAAGIKVRLSLDVEKTFGKIDFRPAYRPVRQPRYTRADYEAQREIDEAARLAAQEEAALLAAEIEAARIAAAAETPPHVSDDEAAKIDVAETPQESPEDALLRWYEAYFAAQDTIQKPLDGYDLYETTLDEKRLRELNEKIVLLRQFPNINIFIYGHSCDGGSQDVKQSLGMQRAETVRIYLINNGININRIIGVDSKRDAEPILLNINEENRKINRRVQILIVE